MKRPLLLSVILFVTSSIIISSCKKDEGNDNQQKTKTKTELLTQGTWILKAETVDPALSINGTQVTNLYAQLDDCDKDDITDLKSDKTYTIEEGATKCNQTDPQVIEDGHWNFNSDETLVILTPTGQTSAEYKIQELNETTLIVVGEETDNNGIKHQFTSTYAHP